MIKYFFIFIFLILTLSLSADEDFIVIQSTTSTRDSGFYDHVLKSYKQENFTKIKVIAVGTGQAIRNSKKCDGDILLVHHKPSEEKFVSEGYGLYRKEIMYNDFVLIGPKNDPANIRDLKNVKFAFKEIYKSKSKFISRGDDSGTHKKEIEIWSQLEKKIKSKNHSWYLETGSGMGSSLNIAVNNLAYILTDRSTWVAFGNKKNHVILLENEPLLKNSYGIIPISPKKCPKTKIEESEKFIKWLMSKKGKKTINSFRVKGQQLFFANIN